MQRRISNDQIWTALDNIDKFFAGGALAWPHLARSCDRTGAQRRLEIVCIRRVGGLV
jgi:hypothetical protein